MHKTQGAAAGLQIIDYDMLDGTSIAVLLSDGVLYGYVIDTTASIGQADTKNSKQKQKQKNQEQNQTNQNQTNQKQKQEKHSQSNVVLHKQWSIKCNDLDLSQCRTMVDVDLQKFNVEYTCHSSCLLQRTRVHWLEHTQCMVIGVSRREYNQLTLWCYPCQMNLATAHADNAMSSRSQQNRPSMAWETRSLCSINNTSSSLWLAPILVSSYSQQTALSTDPRKVFDIFVVTSNHVIATRVPSLQNNMLDWFLFDVMSSSSRASGQSQAPHWKALRQNNFQQLENRFFYSFARSALSHRKWVSLFY
ncbi:hypothetical protein RFI_37425, partial [Reticulomyxa filosa]